MKEKEEFESSIKKLYQNLVDFNKQVFILVKNLQ